MGSGLKNTRVSLLLALDPPPLPLPKPPWQPVFSALHVFVCVRVSVNVGVSVCCLTYQRLPLVLCRILLDLLDDKGKKLGSLPTLETAVLSRAPAYDPSSPEPGGTDASTKVSVYR